MAEYRPLLQNTLDFALPRMLLWRGSGGAASLMGGKGHGCPGLIRTLPLLVVDREEPRKVADGQDDHFYDALGYGLKAYTGLSKLPVEVIYKYNLQGKMPDSPMAADLAMKHAQEIGMAEADPTLDVDGWDAANKLVIIANAVLHRPTTLKDVSVEGIRKVTQDDLRAATEHRQVVKLLAQAEKAGKDYRLSVAPVRLDKTHPLANLGAGMKGVIYHTDINGTIFASIEEDDPYPTAAGVLRDIIQVKS